MAEPANKLLDRLADCFKAEFEGSGIDIETERAVAILKSWRASIEAEAINAAQQPVKVEQDERERGAPGRLAHVLDDTRGYHVECLDEEIRADFLHRLTRAAFDPTQPTSWHPVPAQDATETG